MCTYIGEAFFTEGVTGVQFFVGVSITVANIDVFPERLRPGMTGRFNVILEAVDDGVIVGSPNQAVVKVSSAS